MPPAPFSVLFSLMSHLVAKKDLNLSIKIKIQPNYLTRPFVKDKVHTNHHKSHTHTTHHTPHTTHHITHHVSHTTDHRP